MLYYQGLLLYTVTENTILPDPTAGLENSAIKFPIVIFFPQQVDSRNMMIFKGGIWGSLPAVLFDRTLT